MACSGWRPASIGGGSHDECRYRRIGWRRSLAALFQSPGRRLVVGIGEFAVSDRPGDLIVTHALGSCIAVCLWDPEARVAGMIHFLLPEARINPQRAAEQPAAFADTGIPLVFQAAYRLGAVKSRIACGSSAAPRSQAIDGGDTFNIGRRNLLAAKNVLWRNGVLIEKKRSADRPSAPST